MDSSLFTSSSPGTLVRLEPPRNDRAFIPNDLPPRWKWEPELWALLVEAKEALGTLNGIGQTLPNPQLLLRPLQTREAITSSKIEGTYVTPEQLLLYELDPREPRSAGDEMADWLEVSNYGRALQHGWNLLEELPVCNRVIREIHKVLMTGVRGRDKHPGEFRRWQVQIGSSGRFVPAPPGEVGRLMNSLERYINSDDQFDPLVRCYLVHYQFEAIHPFEDGNGRVGRALLALMVYRWLGHAMPWLYMSAFYERYRDEYIGNLFKVSTSGAWTQWIEFCLRGTISQANDSIRRCHRFHWLRNDFRQRVNSHSKRTHAIIEGLFTSPALTVTSLANRFGVTYHTARADIKRLRDARILAELPGAHPRSYYAPEIMAVAYGESESLDSPDAMIEKGEPIGSGRAALAP